MPKNKNKNKNGWKLFFATILRDYDEDIIDVEQDDESIRITTKNPQFATALEQAWRSPESIR